MAIPHQQAPHLVYHISIVQPALYDSTHTVTSTPTIVLLSSPIIPHLKAHLSHSQRKSNLALQTNEIFLGSCRWLHCLINQPAIQQIFEVTRGFSWHSSSDWLNTSHGFAMWYTWQFARLSGYILQFNVWHALGGFDECLFSDLSW